MKNFPHAETSPTDVVKHVNNIVIPNKEGPYCPNKCCTKFVNNTLPFSNVPNV